MSSRDEQAGAAVYAQALAEAAEERGLLDQVGEEIETLAGRRGGAGPDVQAFFASDAIRREAKMAKVEAAFRGRASDLFVDFLLVLLRRTRQDLLWGIAQEYRKILDRRGNRVPVTVTTAVPASPEDLERWRASLRAATGKEPVLVNRVKPSIIGGVVLRGADIVADGSVRRQLDRMRDRIARAGSPNQAT